MHVYSLRGIFFLIALLFSHHSIYVVNPQLKVKILYIVQYVCYITIFLPTVMLVSSTFKTLTIFLGDYITIRWKRSQILKSKAGSTDYQLVTCILWGQPFFTTPKHLSIGFLINSTDTMISAATRPGGWVHQHSLRLEYKALDRLRGYCGRIAEIRPLGLPVDRVWIIDKTDPHVDNERRKW